MSDEDDYSKYVAAGDGILRTRSYLTDRERWVMWVVVIEGQGVSVWSRKKHARRDLERRLRAVRAER